MLNGIAMLTIVHGKQLHAAKLSFIILIENISGKAHYRYL